MSHTEERDGSIAWLQRTVNARWSAQENPCSGSDKEHALLHLVKAQGRIAAALNDAAHERRTLASEELAKYLADLVICAARLGDGLVDLDAAVRARLLEKFPLAVAAREVET